MPDYLAEIVARKRRELARRRRRAPLVAAALAAVPHDPDRGARAVRALRRPAGELPRVIAEVKLRSPSAGVIRPWAPGEVVSVARAYARGGAAAVSVLADGPGFGGSPLDVRRVSQAVDVPVLFKEFVLDPVQVEIARAVGASLVLLLVRALGDGELRALVAAVREAGMEPVVEAADAGELDRALDTGATVVGVNARDLRTFRVDVKAAGRALSRVPADRVAVFMSGVHDRAGFRRVAEGLADAVLVGEGLMRAPDPEEKLREMLGRPLR